MCVFNLTCPRSSTSVCVRVCSPLMCAHPESSQVAVNAGSVHCAFFLLLYADAAAPPPHSTPLSRAFGANKLHCCQYENQVQLHFAADGERVFVRSRLQCLHHEIRST